MGYAGHHDHFLERLSRIDDDQVDFAMALYHDPHFVRVFLEQSDIPPEYDRVAVAIEHDPDGPHVVVARDGGFVTCLGRGMRPNGLYVIARTEVDQMRALQADIMSGYEALDGTWKVGSLLGRLHQKAHRLDREDFGRLAAIRPLLVTRALERVRQMPDELLLRRQKLEIRLGRKVKRLKPREETMVEQYWNDFFVMHLSSVLVAMSTERLMPFYSPELFVEGFADLPWWTWREGMCGPCLRAMWCAGRMGEAIGDHLLETVREATPLVDLYPKVYSLVVIALRHPQFYQRTVRLFRGWRDGINQIPEAQRTAEQEFRCVYATWAMCVLEQPEECELDFIAIARHLYANILENSPEYAPDDLLGPADELDVYGALTVHMTQHADIRMEHAIHGRLMAAAPVLARVDIRDTYPPRHYARECEPWTPERGVHLFHNHANLFPAPKPVRVDQTPGRNDPCHCESGRKYKRCCMRKDAEGTG